MVVNVIQFRTVLIVVVERLKTILRNAAMMRQKLIDFNCRLGFHLFIALLGLTFVSIKVLEMKLLSRNPA